MYKTILVTLDGTSSDRAIIGHVKPLAKLAQSRVVLLHVADGRAAPTYGPDAVSPEITEVLAYLQKMGGRQGELHPHRKTTAALSLCWLQRRAGHHGQSLQEPGKTSLAGSLPITPH